MAWTWISAAAAAAAAAATAVTTVSAWPLQGADSSNNQRHDYRSSIPQFVERLLLMTPRRVQCQDAVTSSPPLIDQGSTQSVVSHFSGDGSTIHNSTTSTTIPTLTSVGMADPSHHDQPFDIPAYDRVMLQRLVPRVHQWQNMPLPNRNQHPTHAIFGWMQSADAIQSYRVYRPVLNINNDGGNTNDDKFNVEVDQVVVVAFVDWGTHLDGWPGVVHGGILALVLDELGGFAFHAMGVPAAVTANLNINYLKPVPSGMPVAIILTMTAREGRKMYWHMQMVGLESTTEIVIHPSFEPERTNRDIKQEQPQQRHRHHPAVYCEATSLFVIPRDIYETMNTSETKHHLPPLQEPKAHSCT